MRSADANCFWMQAAKTTKSANCPIRQHSCRGGVCCYHDNVTARVGADIRCGAGAPAASTTSAQEMPKLADTTSPYYRDRCVPNLATVEGMAHRRTFWRGWKCHRTETDTTGDGDMMSPPPDRGGQGGRGGWTEGGNRR